MCPLDADIRALPPQQGEMGFPPQRGPGVVRGLSWGPKGLKEKEALNTVLLLEPEAWQ